LEALKKGDGMAQELGVLFDMDGVLVDSYSAHWESWRRLGREVGFDMTERQFVQTFGRTSREVIVESWPDLARAADQITALDRRKESLFREILAADFPAMDGAVELIDALAAAGFVLALGSSGPPENVALVLEKLGCRDRFQAVITGTDVSRGKPDPQVFLLAAERIGLPTRCCLVVEDAPAGIAAARAAGMMCLGLASTGRSTVELAAADRVVTTLRDVTPVQIAALLGGR
jgi:beta-phosphoglucomutase